MDEPRLTGGGIGNPLWPSDALDACGVAARRRVMDVQVGRERVGEEPLDRTLELTAIDELPADHHRIRLKGPHGERAEPQLLRYLVYGVISLLARAHIHRKAHAIGRTDRMVLVIDQQEFVARLRVGEAD